MPRKVVEFHVTADRDAFEKCRSDLKFPYIVALARAVNALNSSHSLIIPHFKVETPETVRNRMNSYFFSSALLYEAIRLVRSMKRTFTSDDAFQKGLMTLLKDPTAQRVEQMHLNPARNHAVFHFLPAEFGRAINKGSATSCDFISARGKKNKSIHYGYADVVAAEMLVGAPSDGHAFWSTLKTASDETGALALKFAKDAEELIGNHLKSWGFVRKDFTV